MYSGINPNSPGQQYECLNTNASNFDYYLIYTSNYSIRTNTFTGICIPDNCTEEEIQDVVEPYNSKVYELNGDYNLDAWSITGLVVLCTWIAVLVIFSVWSSCRDSGLEDAVKSKEDGTEMRADGNLQHQESKENRESVESSFEKEDWKIMNYYAGYQKIFAHSPNKNIMSLINTLAVLGITISV